MDLENKLMEELENNTPVDATNEFNEIMYAITQENKMLREHAREIRETIENFKQEIIKLRRELREENLYHENSKSFIHSSLYLLKR